MEERVSLSGFVKDFVSLEEFIFNLGRLAVCSGLRGLED
jgi:hypothetical protein